MIAIVHKAASEIRLHLTAQRAVVTVLHIIEEMRETPCQSFRLHGMERRPAVSGPGRRGAGATAGRPSPAVPRKSGQTAVSRYLNRAPDVSPDVYGRPWRFLYFPLCRQIREIMMDRVSFPSRTPV